MTQQASVAKVSGSHQSAIVVGVLLTGENSDRLGGDLDELESLLDTLGISAKGRIIQKRQKLTPKCLLGSGKVQEIKDMADRVGAEVIVFDRPLSPPQTRNLEEMTGRRIYDRTGVILEIFSRHARTNQAKTQVEIAQLEYLLPRLAGAWTHFQRQAGGGVRSRGMGEKQVEIDRRRARERIARLQKQLEQFRKEKQEQRKARSDELKVALVGYTNSGKTTLMKTLTKAQIDGRDALFATLDTNIKVIDPKTRPKILLSDTVGFIRNLPHSLIESFKSTLDEVKEADLLLLVVDVSYPHYEEHIETTRKVLEEIGAGDIPTIVVFNKVDLIDDPILARVLKSAYRGSIVLSAYQESDAERLRDHVYRFFKQNMIDMTVAVALEDQAVLSLIYNSSLILDTDYSEPGRVVFTLRTSQATAAKLKQYVLSRDSEVKEALLYQM